jgi:hypothetical protein
MSHTRTTYVLAAILVMMFGIAGGILIASCTSPGSTNQTRGSAELTGITHFNNLSTTDLTVTDDLTVSDDATIAGDLAVTGAVEIAGTSTLEGITIMAASDITVTTATITPTVSAYHADSAGAVTWTLPACAVNGQLLLIYGDDNNTITIADSSLRSTDGNAVTIGQYDVVLFVCFDTEWNHVAKSANS